MPAKPMVPRGPTTPAGPAANPGSTEVAKPGPQKVTMDVVRQAFKKGDVEAVKTYAAQYFASNPADLMAIEKAVMEHGTGPMVIRGIAEKAKLSLQEAADLVVNLPKIRERMAKLQKQ